MWPFSRKKTRTDADPKRDGLTNVLTGIATDRDKRSGASYASNVVTDLAARELWRGSDIGARVVETLPDEALRPGFGVQIQDDEDGEQSREVNARTEELHIIERLRLGAHYQRAYGGAALFPVINDGQDLAAPLAEERITDVRQVHVFEPVELDPLSYYTDPREEKFGQAKLYRLTPIQNRGHVPQVEIHESRLVILQGIRVTRADVASVRTGWGDSVFSRLLPVLVDFDSAFHGAGALVQDFAQAVFKLEGFSSALSSGNEQAIVDRMRAIDLSRSVLRGVMIDSRDDFMRVPTPLSGLPEIIDRFMQRMAAAAGMPVTLLMGMSPAGMNATGESDRVSWFNTCDAWREREMRPALERLVRLLLLAKAGPTNGKEPENWSVVFKPLWQPSQKEIVETRYIQAQADAIYLSNGVVGAMDVAQSRFGGSEYSHETQVDFKALETMQAAELEREEQMAAAQAEAAKKPPSEDPVPGEDVEEDEKEEEAA